MVGLDGLGGRTKVFSGGSGYGGESRISDFIRACQFSTSKYSPLVSLLAFTTANFISSEVRVAYTLYNSPQASASASSEIEMLLQPTIPPVFVMRPT